MVLEGPEEDPAPQGVAVKGFRLFWPLRFTLRGFRELPVKVGNMFGGVAPRRPARDPVVSR